MSSNSYDELLFRLVASSPQRRLNFIASLILFLLRRFTGYFAPSGSLSTIVILFSTSTATTFHDATSNNTGFPETEALLRNAYAAFNTRNIDAALATMQPDVCWPNGMEGGVENGHAAVRSYWTRQWQMIDPTVEPLHFELLDNGKLDVTVHQLIKSMSGDTLTDTTVHHVYTIADGLIQQMEIK